MEQEAKYWRDKWLEAQRELEALRRVLKPMGKDRRVRVRGR